MILISALFTGCHALGSKSVGLSAIYAAAAVLSLMLLVGCCITVRRKRLWFVVLFSSVLTVNVGYTLLSLSPSLEAALWSNRLAYLGSVFLPLSMLMIILDVSGTKHVKWLDTVLLLLAAAVFLIAASPGFSDIYYKEVSFAVVNGSATLIKVYGPLHPIYLVYLLAYFGAMVAVIVRAKVKKTIDTALHGAVMAVAVFINIGVWFIEQIASIDFEMLSISYIVSELFLLIAHIIANENQRLRAIVSQAETARADAEKEEDCRREPGETARGGEAAHGQEMIRTEESKELPVAEEAEAPGAMLETPIGGSVISPERYEIFVAGIEKLTPTEKLVYEAHVARATTAEIMASLNIKESTLKYHNRNIYGKLGVSSRKELVEMHKHVKTMQRSE